MSKLLYALLVGLVGAALVHVGLVLALPVLAADQAWTRLAAALPPETPRRAEDAGLPGASSNPLFRTVVCRVDLRRGPALLSATGRAAFWSAAVFTPDGRAIAGVNSGMAGTQAPDLRILSPKDAGADTGRTASDRAFPLVAEAGEAVLVLRVFVPDESWAPLADALLNGVACRTETGVGRSQ